MDREATIQELKNVVERYCRERDWDQYHNPKELSLALILEAAELLEHFRYMSAEEVEKTVAIPRKKTEIGEEMADILFLLLRIAQMEGIDLATAFKNKMRKNAEKYPIEKSRGSNKKYTEFVDM